MSTTDSRPRYIQLSNQLRAKIQRGEWNVGERLPSFADMYVEYGASTVTMQRVYDVLQKEGLIERRARSGVYVTKCKPSQTGVLAYVIPDEGEKEGYISSSYSMKLLHSAHQEIASQGYQMALCTLAQLRTYPHPINGCIVQGDLKLVRSCAGSNIPTVSLISSLRETSSVGTDEIQGFKDITNYLINQGHKRIAALIGSTETYGNDDMISPLRVQGYLQAMKENNIHVPKKWIRRIHKNDAEFSFANWRHWSYQTMRQWLKQDWADLGCTAIVTQNDSTAIGVIRALRQHGYRVPQDVSVTGCDNSGEDAHFDLKITTLHVPLEEIAKRAVDALIQLITAPQKCTEKIDYPTRVVIGESTASPKGYEITA